MTDARDDQTTPGPRRPPGPPAQWATVTRLGLPRQEDDPMTRPATSSPAVTGNLALAAPSEPVHGAGLPARPGLRLLPGGGSDEPPTPGADEVKVWAGRFAQAVVEVLGGDRPLGQLVRWTSERVYLELERRLAILTRTQDAGRRMRTVRPQVRSVHVFHPTPVSAEVSVHVRHGQRSRAIAARLELVRGRWQCTTLLLG